MNYCTRSWEADNVPAHMCCSQPRWTLGRWRCTSTVCLVRCGEEPSSNLGSPIHALAFPMPCHKSGYFGKAGLILRVSAGLLASLCTAQWGLSDMDGLVSECWCWKQAREEKMKLQCCCRSQSLEQCPPTWAVTVRVCPASCVHLAKCSRWTRYH